MRWRSSKTAMYSLRSCSIIWPGHFAVPLHPGDCLLFNPLIPHCILSHCKHDNEIMCVLMYMKTAIVGSNDNLLPLSILPWDEEASKLQCILCEVVPSSDQVTLQFLSVRVIVYYSTPWFHIVFCLTANMMMRLCVFRCTWRQQLLVWMTIRCH
jgi:hypothetical protein